LTVTVANSVLLTWRQILLIIIDFNIQHLNCQSSDLVILG